MTASIIGLRLEEDGITTTVKLDTGDKIINSLHLVRRVSMRTIGTSEVIWNPINEWKELSNMYMNPTEFAKQPCVDDNEDGSPVTNECTEKSKTVLDYERSGSRKNAKKNHSETRST